jgi:hypothetical protein
MFFSPDQSSTGPLSFRMETFSIFLGGWAILSS